VTNFPVALCPWGRLSL